MKIVSKTLTVATVIIKKKTVRVPMGYVRNQARRTGKDEDDIIEAVAKRKIAGRG